MDNHQGQINSLTEFNHFFESISKRTEKIVTALYMVTDCIDEKEPIKDRLRATSLDLMSMTKELERISAIERGLVMEDTRFLISEIISFVSIACAVSLITEMNSGIIIRELTKVSDALADRIKTAFNARGGGESLASFVLPEELFQEENDKGQNISKGHENSMSFRISRTNESAKPGLIAQKIPKETQTKKYDLALKINRRNSILELIKDKKEVTIKDISTIISDCSEKTIQRELMSLISSGVLEKSGSKRWSVYRLK